MYTIEPHTSKIITYVYTFTPQQGVSGRDENAEPILRTSHLVNTPQGVRGAEEGNTRVVLLQLRLGI
jgi:hypothetical protein